MGAIVVGVDESAGAAEALRWAAEEGRRRGWAVRAVMCWGYLDQHHAVPDQKFDPDYGETGARQALGAIIAAALHGNDAATIEAVVVNDLAPRGLLERSADTELLVLGARGLGRFREFALGSVSRQCLHHATVPVAIVRPHQPPADATHPRVVVGVDGSETAQRALDWALEAGRRRQASVAVIHAWVRPFVGGVYVPVLADHMPFEKIAHDIVDTAVDAADTTGLPGPVERIVARGNPASVLVDAASGADLVVVGSRGLGGFKGLLLGSVSHDVTHHAPCPVVVIPHTE